MAPHASSIMTMSLDTGPEQLTVSPGLALAESPPPVQRDRLWPLAGSPPPVQRDRRRPLEVAQCSLCDIAVPLGLLVPDGGQACADIRWYCKDARSCTERWTTARPRARAHTQAVPCSAVAGAGEAAPDGSSDEQLGGVLEEATSAV